VIIIDASGAVDYEQMLARGLLQRRMREKSEMEDLLAESEALRRGTADSGINNIRW
jgi:hypothetical protein